MPRQTPGNYVPLDVNYPRSRRIRRAGEAAELLYIRSLAYAKGAKTNGNVPSFDLEVVGIGLRSLNKRVAALVREGLWTETEDGWFITDWWEWNGTVADEAAFIESQSDKGSYGNHERWHTAKGITNPDCRYCNPDRSSDRTGDPSSDRQPDRTPESPIREGKGREGKATATKVAHDRFEEFWAIYPRKKDKGHARQAWTSAVKRTDPQVVIDSATSFAALIKKAQTEPQFMPYPATWLRGERWVDEPDDNSAAAGQQWFER